MNGFLKLRRGLIEHFEKDKISYVEAGLYIYLMLRADYKTGVVFIRTSDLVNEENNYQKVYRALKHLEENKYIRTFRRTGSKSRFAVIINKHIREEDGKVLNAFKSKSWDDLVWESCRGDDEVVMRTRGGDDEVVKPFSSQIEESKEVAIPKEVRSKELKNEEREEEMKAAKQIPILSLQILGIKAERYDNIWSEVKELTEAFGQDAVIEAFKTWAASQDPDTVTRPVSAFLSVATGILRGIRTAGANPGGKQLVIDLAAMSNGEVTFVRRHADEISRLLDTFSEIEIKAAFRDFLGKLDDFKLRTAAKDFSETAEQIINSSRQRKQEFDNINNLSKSLAEKESREAQERLRIAEQQETEEIDDLPTV